MAGAGRLRGMFLVAAVVVLWPSLVRGQAVSELPRAEYYLGLDLYGAGRTGDALEAFQSAYQGARKIGTQRWIDSLPPLVMIGECYYQQGNLAQAAEYYDAALNLALAHPVWIDQLEVPTTTLQEIGSDAAMRSINWFPASRPLRPVTVPEAMELLVDPSQSQVTQPGVVVAPVSLVTRLDVSEVLRTMALALHRRWQLLGPLAPYSPLSEPLAKMLSRQPTVPINWVQSSWMVLRGISQLSTRASADAANAIRAGMLLPGGGDYFLTPRASLVLAELDRRQGAVAPAMSLLQDAILLAGYYRQHDILSAALAKLTALAASGRRTDMVSSFQRVAAWGTKTSLLAHAYATLAVLELSLEAGQFALFDRTSQQLAGTLRGRDTVMPRPIAHLAMVLARAAWARGRASVAQGHLDNALRLMHGSAQSGAAVERVFQIQLVLDLYSSGSLTMADAERALGQLLAEPSESQWRDEPLDMLAFLTTSSLPAYRVWFEMAMARGDLQAQVMRADRLHRQRFFESLPLAGRALSWRLACLTPTEQLPASVRPVVQAAVGQHGQLAAARGRWDNAWQSLHALPVPVDERQLTAEQKRAWAECLVASQELEDQVSLLALSRYSLPRFVPWEMTSVPAASVVPPTDAILAWAVSNSGALGILITEDGVETWRVEQVDAVRSRIALLLREIGLVRQQAPLLPSVVMASEAAWRQTAEELRDLLLPADIQARLHQAQRWIIVPHEQLWYLPWELLPEPQQGGGGGQRVLAMHEVVYAPTLGMSLRSHPGGSALNTTVGVQGRLLAADLALNAQLHQSLVAARPGTLVIDANQKVNYPSPVWLRARTDLLWSTQTVDIRDRELEVTWIPPVRGQGDPLRGWLRVPLGGPSLVILPGINGGLATGGLGDGDELFLPACALQVSGVRGAVLSRWPTGGRSTAALLERYLREVSLGSWSAAWRRSVLSMWANQWLIAEEPALLPAGKEAENLVTGEHPLLWAGYLHIGDGVADDQGP
ncbi:MAG: hypothetical protein KatS3mg111_2030 [Pirellulaceae bacterium]|nr:MAG: hypothetical protein KatS3mg111_2030 [Pirellulaceae bacterium]